MKNVKCILVILCLALSLNVSIATQRSFGGPVHVLSVQDDWQKSNEGAWPGTHDEKTYWYRLDKNAMLSWSADGKNWSEVKIGMWSDKNGRWIRINNKMLVWSDDMGKTWSEVPEWKWEGPDSNKYKFDKNWELWVKK